MPLLIEVLQHIELSSNRSDTPSVVFFNILQLGSLDCSLFCLVKAVGYPAKADVFPVFASLYPKSRLSEKPKSKSQRLQKKGLQESLCQPPHSQRWNIPWNVGSREDLISKNIQSRRIEFCKADRTT